MTQETIQPIQSNPAKTALRKLVPDLLLREREIVLHLGPEAGRTYIGLRLLDGLGVRASNQRMVPSSSRSFVFVCWGNIMRSAMAEFLMNQALRDAGLAGQLQIRSAGLHATPGREAHPWAQAASAQLGISLNQHRAKLLTREMVETADCIFAMDFQNKAELLTLYPGFREKVYMLSAYAEGPGRYRQIPDPYHGDLQGTLLCGQQLQSCICNLMKSLFPASASNKAAIGTALTDSSASM